MDCALATRDSSRVKVNGHLMGSHLVLWVATSTVSPNAWSLVTFEHFKEGLSSSCLHSAGNTIGRDAVDPDHLVIHFDSAIGRGGTKH